MANDPRFEVYSRRRAELRDSENADAEYGWRFRAANGQITAIGGEGFTRREDAERAVSDFLRAVWAETPVPPPDVMAVSLSLTPEKMPEHLEAFVWRVED